MNHDLFLAGFSERRLGEPERAGPEVELDRSERRLGEPERAGPEVELDRLGLPDVHGAQMARERRQRIL
jgi:hypothetical protein